MHGEQSVTVITVPIVTPAWSSILLSVNLTALSKNAGSVTAKNKRMVCFSVAKSDLLGIVDTATFGELLKQPHLITLTKIS